MDAACWELEPRKESLSSAHWNPRENENPAGVTASRDNWKEIALFISSSHLTVSYQCFPLTKKRVGSQLARVCGKCRLQWTWEERIWEQTGKLSAEEIGDIKLFNFIIPAPMVFSHPYFFSLWEIWKYIKSSRCSRVTACIPMDIVHYQFSEEN